MEAAEAHIRLHVVDASGVTAKQHLEQVWRQTGRKPDALNVPEIPETMRYLFDVFVDLCAAKKDEPIRYESIESYARLNGVEFRWWEVDAIRGMDAAWQKVRSEPNG